MFAYVELLINKECDMKIFVLVETVSFYRITFFYACVFVSFAPKGV